MNVATGRDPVRLDRGAVPTSERVLNPLARASLRFLLVAAAAAVVAYAVVHVRLVVVPLVVALLLSTLLVGPADRLRRHGLPSALATGVVLAAAVALVALAVTLVAPPVAGELGRLGELLQEGVDEVAGWVAGGPFGLSEREVDRIVDGAGRQASTGASTVAGGVVSASILALEVLAGVLLVVVLTFFLVHDGGTIWRWLVGLLPGDQHERMEAFGASAWAALSAYVRGVAVVAVVDAVFIGLALWLIGVPLVLPLAVLTFLAAFVPLVGAVVAGAVAALVALVSGGPVDALLVVGAVTLVQQLEGDLLYPVVVGRAIELHAVAILLSVTAGAVLLGVVGAALAVPVTAVTWAGIKAWREDGDP